MLEFTKRLKIFLRMNKDFYSTIVVGDYISYIYEEAIYRELLKRIQCKSLNTYNFQ